MTVLDEAPPVRPAPDTASQRWTWAIVYRLLGLILLVAALLKGYDLATAPTAENHLLEKRWVLIPAVQFEFLLAICLLAGIYPRVIWRITLATFACFLAIAVYKLLSGADSCGCFGRVRVSPSYTAAFDALALFALVMFPPSQRPPSARHVSRVAWAAIALVVIATLAPGTWLMARFTPDKIGSDGMIMAGDVVVLEPQVWIGKFFPLHPHIDIGSQLLKGNWVVFLYRSDCDHCQRAIPRYEAVALRGKHQAHLPSVALVELPPYASPEAKIVSDNSAAVRGKLTDKHEWFASTPVMLKLIDGRVVAAAENDKAEFPDVALTR